MNVGMNGKKIKTIFWPDTESEQWRHMTVGEDCEGMHLSATHHGDRDEFWIIVTKDGKEFRRYNPRYVESIEWDEE